MGNTKAKLIENVLTIADSSKRLNDIEITPEFIRAIPRYVLNARVPGRIYYNYELSKHTFHELDEAPSEDETDIYGENYVSIFKIICHCYVLDKLDSLIDACLGSGMDASLITLQDARNGPCSFRSKIRLLQSGMVVTSNVDLLRALHLECESECLEVMQYVREPFKLIEAVWAQCSAVFFRAILKQGKYRFRSKDCALARSDELLQLYMDLGMNPSNISK